jgi:hypothetical protein
MTSALRNRSKWIRFPDVHFISCTSFLRSSSSAVADLVTMNIPVKICFILLQNWLSYTPMFVWNIQAYLGYCVTSSNYALYPRIHRWQIRVEKRCWTSLAWCRRLNNSMDNDYVIFLEARLEITSHANARALSTKNNSRAACLCLFKTRG